MIRQRAQILGENNMNVLIWIGILFCISQSAMFSGLNLALFSLDKLHLEVEASKSNSHAKKILKMRDDANFLLTTILWGNVGINVLLTLLSKSMLTGVSTFIFSTFVITLFGEIAPQAYFSRHAMQTGALLSPVVRFYQILLFPVAKPTAFILDRWLGPEAIRYIQERDLRHLIKLHVESPETEIDEVEGTGALNFLAIDDLPIADEGEVLDPASVIELQFESNRPVFPKIEPTPEDDFLRRIESSGKKWVVVTDTVKEPRVVINADSFLRNALFGDRPFNPNLHCHRPIIVKDPHTPLGETILHLKVHPIRSDDDVIDEDIILLWGDHRRVITGSDILGRLLRGIVRQEHAHFWKTTDRVG